MIMTQQKWPLVPFFRESGNHHCLATYNRQDIVVNNGFYACVSSPMGRQL